MNNISVLYITYDGISDHIGQSQVAPYLIGLAQKGHQITLLSAEKPERVEIIEKYKKIFFNHGIEWHFIPYHWNPPVFSTVYDVWRMKRIAQQLVRKNNIAMVHCRSYVSSLIGLSLKRKFRTKFLFDMRDFWPDARKEVKSFDVENNWIHKIVYNYFKKKEREFFESADHIISLTEAGRRVIEEWGKVNLRIKANISVIPCCADYSFFDPESLDVNRKEQIRKRLGINEGEFVLNYLGSLGPAYLTNELLDFYKVLLKYKPGTRFLVVANNDHEIIKEAARRKGIDSGKLIVTKGAKEDIPYLIALSNLSAFFIMPSFAKQACSPTKLAELFAMNVPVVSNTNVGDLDSILNLKDNGSEVVKRFDEIEYERVVVSILKILNLSITNIRSNTCKRFSVISGIELYNEVYNSILNN